MEAYDSLLNREYPKHRLYAVAYDPRWQRLKDQCSFQTAIDALRSITLLNEYTMAAETLEERQIRYYQAHTLLRSVPLGQANDWGEQYFDRDAQITIEEERKAVKEVIEEVGRPQKWDWHRTRKLLHEMLPEHLDYLEGHLKGLLIERGAKREAMGWELKHYVRMLEDILWMYR